MTEKQTYRKVVSTVGTMTDQGLVDAALVFVCDDEFELEEEVRFTWPDGSAVTVPAKAVRDAAHVVLRASRQLSTRCP